MKKTLIFSVIVLFSLFLYGMMDKDINKSNSHNKVISDGVALKVMSEVVIAEGFNASTFSVKLGSGDLILKGTTGKNVNLSIKYYEYEKGDATIFIKDGKLDYSTKSGKPVQIYLVDGTVPDKVSLDAKTGSGDITLSFFHKSEFLNTVMGSGDVNVSNVTNIGNISIKTGSGDVQFDNLDGIKEVQVVTGSGDLQVSNCKNIESLVNKSGSAEVVLTNYKGNHVQCQTGSGDLAVNGSSIEQLEFKSGSGDIVINKSTIKKRMFQTSAGDIVEQKNVE